MEATKPMRAEAHGRRGEKRVDSKLNPLIFGVVEHRQINNLILVDEYGKSHQIDHIEIRENGIFCIETKNYLGLILGRENDSHWTQCLYNGEQYKLLNPLKQNKSHCYHVSKVLGKGYVVNSVVVLVQNNADRLAIDNVVNINDLKRYLKRFDNGVNLSIEEMDNIYNKLMSAASDMTNEEHVKNIKETQKQIDSNICPRCGGNLVLRTSSKGNQFYGCSNYPRCRFSKNVK